METVENTEAIARRAALIADLVRELEQADDGVDDELRSLRVAMAYLLRTLADNPIKASQAMADVASSIIRARTHQRVASGEAVDNLAEAASRILEELGYGQ